MHIAAITRSVRVLTSAPDVVVLEHDHRAEVVAVRVDAADQHAVLLDEAEAWRMKVSAVR